MKLERKHLLHYIDATPTGQTRSWFLLGKDIEEMAVDLGVDVEVVKNILGETSVKDNGYQPVMEATPFYANPDDAIYEFIRDIALQRKKGDACKTKILEIIIDVTGTTTSSYLAFTEDVVIKPTSYGGGTEGVNIPFNIYFDGNRTKGTATITSGVPTFTADT